jgi:hypothetical protein
VTPELLFTAALQLEAGWPELTEFPKKINKDYQVSVPDDIIRIVKG